METAGKPGKVVEWGRIEEKETSTQDEFRDLPSGLVVKNPPCIGGGNGNPLQYSCLENPMDRGAWQATVHGVPKSWT